MTEKWLIAPGQERVIDIERASKLKIGLVGGQVDVIAHDEPGIRIEVHNGTIKDLRIESDGTQIEIDHPQIGWDNFLEVFRNFGAGGPKAEISVAVPRDIALTLGVVSAGALVSGLTEDARLNTVMKKLTSWAAIIAVPTAVTGFYGQNVPYPGFAREWGFLLSCLVIALGAGLLYVGFKRRDWL